jgi:hypothetical protein
MPLSVGLFAWTLLAVDAVAQSTSQVSAATARLSGRVVSAYAGSVADATITVTAIGANAPSPTTAEARSDRQGVFTFDRLAAGRYRVTASKAGFTSRQFVSSPAPRFEEGVEVTVTAGQPLANMELVLRRASSIAGRIAEPDGIPAPDVEVFAAVRQGNGHAVLAESRTTTAWNGRYRLTDLPPGEYLVVVRPGTSADPNRARANAERRAPESSSAARPFFDDTLYPGVTNDADADAVTVFEDVSAEGIDIWLTPGERFTITGRVFWPEGATAQNITIEYANLSAQRSGLWTVPEPGDYFAINGVPTGLVMLMARADSNRGPLAGVISTEVHVGGVDDVELTLRVPGTVEGRIIYEGNVPASSRPSRVALKQRLLPVSPLYPVPESAIGANGAFQIRHALGMYDVELPDLPAGFRIVRVTQHGRALPESRVHVAAGETIDSLEIVVGR